MDTGISPRELEACDAEWLVTMSDVIRVQNEDAKNRR